MDWTPSVGEWVATPDGEGQVTHCDADTGSTDVRVGGVVRTYAASALKRGKPSSAWGA